MIAPEALRALIARHPSLGGWKGIVKNGLSVNSATCLFETEAGLFFAKRYALAERDLAGIAGEHAIIRHLTARRYPTPALLADGEGQTIMGHEGAPYAFFAAAEGEDRYAGAPVFAAMSPLEAGSAGRRLAELHLALQDGPSLAERPFRGLTARYRLMSAPTVTEGLATLLTEAPTLKPWLCLPWHSSDATHDPPSALTPLPGGGEGGRRPGEGGSSGPPNAPSPPPAAEPLPMGREAAGAGEASDLSVGSKAVSLLALLPWLEDRRDRLAPLLPAMPHGLIHGDWIKRNLFWRGDEVAAVIDFDLWNVAPLAFDLALALLPAGFDWPRVLAGEAGPNRPVMQAMVQGYEAIRPLTPAERQGLPWLLETARLEFYLSAIHAAIGRGAPEEADRFFDLLLATTRWFSLHPAASRSFFA